MKPDSFLITKNQQSNSSNQCCKLLNTTTQAGGHSQQHRSASRNPDLGAKFPPKKPGRLCQTHREHCTNLISRIPRLTPENPPPLPACGGGWGWWWRWSGGAWHGPAAWYPWWFPSPGEWKRILVEYQTPAMEFSGDKKPLSPLWDCQLSSSGSTQEITNQPGPRTKMFLPGKVSVPSLSKARKKVLLTICSDFSALSLISLILPKSCWMAFWASSRAWKRNKVRVERKSAFSFHLSKKYTVTLNTLWGWGTGGEQLSLKENTSSTKKSMYHVGILNLSGPGFQNPFYNNDLAKFHQDILWKQLFKVTGIYFDILSVEK